MKSVSCPFCSKQIQAGVDICGWCETSLSTGLVRGQATGSAVSIDQVVQQYEALESWQVGTAGDPVDPKRPFRWHWLLPVLAAGIFAFFRHAYPDTILAVPILLGSILLLGFALKVMKGSPWIPPSRCTQPRQAMEMFLASVTGLNTAGNAYAYWLAFPDKSTKSRETPRIPDVTEPRLVRDFAKQDGFVAYWSHFLGSTVVSDKKSEYRVGIVEEIAPGYAVVDASIRLRTVPTEAVGPMSISPLVAHASMHEHWFNLHKLVVKRNGRWWVANGEADDSVDRALTQVIKTRRPAPRTSA
jgi:hypothetical protein